MAMLPAKRTRAAPNTILGYLEVFSINGSLHFLSVRTNQGSLSMPFSGRMKLEIIGMYVSAKKMAPNSAKVMV